MCKWPFFTVGCLVSGCYSLPESVFYFQVSVLGCPDPVVHEIAYQYGIAFQLIGDILDFTSCSDQMGKPISADLKLGLATGPVLFACQQVGFIVFEILLRSSTFRHS